MPKQLPEINDKNRVNLWIRLVSITPLLVLGLAWLISPELRGTMGQGIDLLWQRDVQGLRKWGSSLGWWAPLLTGSLMIVQAIAAPIPAVLVTATNSFLFGPFWGGLYSILTANVAAAICYGLGRGYGTFVSDAILPSRTIKRYEHFFDEHGGKTVLVARLIPFVPFDPISYIAGIVRMPFWSFFLATLVGQFPAGMAYSYLAQEVDKPQMFVVSTVSLLAALFLTGWFLNRAFFKKKPSDSQPPT